jgi:hypothetical protein
MPRNPGLHRQLRQNSQLIKDISNAFREIFRALPLTKGAITSADQRKWLLVHGGISDREITEAGIVCEDFNNKMALATWHDFGWHPQVYKSRGGETKVFGPDTLHKLLRFDFSGLVCGHLHDEPILGMDSELFTRYGVGEHEIRRYITFPYPGAVVPPYYGKLTKDGWQDIEVQQVLRSWPEEIRDAFLTADTLEDIQYMLSGLFRDMLIQVFRGEAMPSVFAKNHSEKCALILLIFMHCNYIKGFIQDQMSVKEFFSDDFLYTLTQNSLEFLLDELNFADGVMIDHIDDHIPVLRDYFRSWITENINKLRVQDLEAHIRKTMLTDSLSYSAVTTSEPSVETTEPTSGFAPRLT